MGIMKTKYLIGIVLLTHACADENLPIEPEMIFVKGGTFKMGCTSEQVANCMSDEMPTLEVRLDDFWIGKYEVTNTQFSDFLKDKGNQTKGGSNWYKVDKYSQIKANNGVFKPQEGFENYPVTNVSWYGATAYAKWLSQKTKKDYRLPTEAEWEYAARGGQKNKGFIYSGSNSLEEVAWFGSNASNSRTGWNFKQDNGIHPVGQKLPNELGLFDMSGNVGEWCADLYENFYEGGINPKGAKYGSLRVMRGGSWDNRASECRVSQRNYDQHINRFSVNDGFRLALTNK